jgi:hypothetical protein
MRHNCWCAGILMLFASALLVGSVGCGKGADKDKGTTAAQKTTTTGKDDLAEKDKEAQAWWCTEHGVPEHECSLCLDDDVVKKMFKDKGDWCKIHDRAQSQCFKCDPKLYETFEAKYAARYGKKPPRPPAKEFQK